MQFAHKTDYTRNRGYAELHLPKDVILAPAEFLEFWIWAVSKKMTQDVAAFAAIENEIQFGLGDRASQGLEKPTPSPAMHCMTVDQDSVHVKNDAAQRSSGHRLSPGNMRCASRPWLVD